MPPPQSGSARVPQSAPVPVPLPPRTQRPKSHRPAPRRRRNHPAGHRSPPALYNDQAANKNRFTDSPPVPRPPVRRTPPHRPPPPLPSDSCVVAGGSSDPLAWLSHLPSPLHHRQPPQLPTDESHTFSPVRLPPDVEHIMIGRARQSRPWVLNEQDASEAPWAMVLVEMNCQQGMGSMRHDRLKYDRYFERLSEAMGSGVWSADGRHKMDVVVQMTPPVMHATSPPAWNSTGGLPVIPRGDLLRRNTNPYRFGAFEVHLITNLPGVRNVEPCVNIFSKLSARRWPNAHLLVRRCQAALAPAFRQWDADARLRDAMPLAKEASDVQALVCEYEAEASISILEQLRLRLSRMNASDAEIMRGMQTDEDSTALESALGSFREDASPSIVAAAEKKLREWACNMGTRVANTELRETPAEEDALCAAIAKHRAIAYPEEITQAEERLRMVRADAALLGEISKLDEAAMVRSAITMYDSMASKGALDQANGRLRRIETSDVALRMAIELGDTRHLRKAMEDNGESASPSMLTNARQALLRLEADESLRMARMKADEALRAVPSSPSPRSASFSFKEHRFAFAHVLPDPLDSAQPDPDVLQLAIESHRELASAEVVAETEERLRVLRADIAMSEELAPLSEATALRTVIDKYYAEVSEEAIEEADVRLDRIEAADARLLLAMEGDIAQLQNSIDELAQDASPSFVSIAKSVLRRLVADATIRATPATNAGVLRAVIEEHKEAASQAAVADAEDRVRALEAADIALKQAMHAGLLPLLVALNDHRKRASPSVVEEAEVVLERLEKEEAERIRRADADAALRATPIEPSALKQAMEAHGMHASGEALAEAAALCDVTTSLMRELEADNAFQQLILSSAFLEASSIRSVLQEHGKYAASVLVESARTQMQALERADTALRAAMKEVACVRAHDTVDYEAKHHLSPVSSSSGEATDQKGAMDKLFQALVDFGPCASKTVRIEAWREGGWTLCLKPTIQPTKRSSEDDALSAESSEIGDGVARSCDETDQKQSPTLLQKSDGVCSSPGSSQHERASILAFNWNALLPSMQVPSPTPSEPLVVVGTTAGAVPEGNAFQEGSTSEDVKLKSGDKTVNLHAVLEGTHAIAIQKVARGRSGRARLATARAEKRQSRELLDAKLNELHGARGTLEGAHAIAIQRVARGRSGRVRLATARAEKRQSRELLDTKAELNDTRAELEATKALLAQVLGQCSTISSSGDAGHDTSQPGICRPLVCDTASKFASNLEADAASGKLLCATSDLLKIGESAGSESKPHASKQDQQSANGALLSGLRPGDRQPLT